MQEESARKAAIKVILSTSLLKNYLAFGVVFAFLQ